MQWITQCVLLCVASAVVPETCVLDITEVKRYEDSKHVEFRVISRNSFTEVCWPQLFEEYSAIHTRESSKGYLIKLYLQNRGTYPCSDIACAVKAPLPSYLCASVPGLYFLYVRFTLLTA